MGRLQRIFGARNFVVVDNNEIARGCKSYGA